MKWINQILLVLYGLTALYFLYTAAMGIFVYFANKSMGHYESFLVPGRNLVVGLILAGLTALAWYCVRQPVLSKTAYFLLYLPVIIIGVIFILILINYISGARWN
jgi:hypothetical protein